MTEVTIHQSLKVHPNIVTLHCSLETDALLLPVLEYVPGEDLYYFLEQEQQQKEKERIGDARTGDLAETESRSSSVYSMSSSSYGSSDVFEDEDEDEDEEPVRGRRTRRHHHRRPR
jgi:serine/threonine protein kinase